MAISGSKISSSSPIDTPTILTEEQQKAFGVALDDKGTPTFPGFKRDALSEFTLYPTRCKWTAYVRSGDPAKLSGKSDPDFSQAREGLTALVVGLQQADGQFAKPVRAWDSDTGTLVTFPDATAQSTRFFHLLESVETLRNQDDTEGDTKHEGVSQEANSTSGPAGSRFELETTSESTDGPRFQVERDPELARKLHRGGQAFGRCDIL